MKVFHGIAAAGKQPDCAFALGNFDGVHVGHQALFSRAGQLGHAAVLTFHPHPGKILQPELAPKLITLLQRKLELMESWGVKVCVVQPFSREYAHTTPEEFEKALLDDLGAKHWVVGADFTYGARRAGTVSTLTAAAAGRGAQVHVVSPVTVDGVVASSSKVREYILEGRVSAAHRLLNRYFDLDGLVVPGQGRGRGIGFPTANVDTLNELRPAAGAYAVRAGVMDQGHVHTWWAGAANIGVKPTFGGNEVTIEVHLLDFSGDLYGKPLRIQFVERLRAEQRFASVSELSLQIRRDVEAARELIARASQT